MTPFEGVIVEDRGNLGVEGRRLSCVLLQLDEITEPSETTLRDDELTLVAKAPSRSRNGRRG
jgi:hypothetical protein